MPTVLLCHFDGTTGSTVFTDSSSFAHTLTAVNSTVVSTTTPKFGTGSGDFGASINTGIDTNNAADFNLGSGQFTVEAWAYFTSAPGGNIQAVLSQWGFNASLGWFFGMVGGPLAFYYSIIGTDNPFIGGSYTPALNTWIHLAADRDAFNVLRVYANGVVIASQTVLDTIFPSTQTCMIGNDHNLTRAFPGRLDDARIIKGVALYGGAFTPPTGPFSFGPTVLLCHFDGTTGSSVFIDRSSYAHTLTALGSAVVTTTSPKFGTGSGDFAGSSGAGIDTGNATDFNLGSGQFTLEAWGYFTSGYAPSYHPTIMSQFGASSNLGWSFGFNGDLGVFQFVWSTTGSDFPRIIPSYTQALNTWVHFACDRDASNVIRLYVNGAVVASQTVPDTIFPSTQTCMIGNDHNLTRAFPGHLDEARITKGSALYAGAFTPPTGPFNGAVGAQARLIVLG